MVMAAVEEVPGILAMMDGWPQLCEKRATVTSERPELVMY